MGRIKALLAAPFQRGVGGDERAVLEDANRIGEDVDVEDPTSRRVRHAVEIAADAHHAFCSAPLQSEHRLYGRRGRGFSAGFSSAKASLTMRRVVA